MPSCPLPPSMKMTSGIFSLPAPYRNGASAPASSPRSHRRGDAADIVAPILRAHRAVTVEHHARSHGLFAHGMADIEALHAVDFRQVQHLGQLRQPLMDRRLLRKLGGQRRCRVGTRQLQITGAVTARLALNLDLAPRQLGERLRKQVFSGRLKSNRISPGKVRARCLANRTGRQRSAPLRSYPCRPAL